MQRFDPPQHQCSVYPAMDCDVFFLSDDDDILMSPTLPILQCSDLPLDSFMDPSSACLTAVGQALMSPIVSRDSIYALNDVAHVNQINQNLYAAPWNQIDATFEHPYATPVRTQAPSQCFPVHSQARNLVPSNVGSFNNKPFSESGYASQPMVLSRSAVSAAYASEAMIPPSEYSLGPVQSGARKSLRTAGSVSTLPRRVSIAGDASRRSTELPYCHDCKGASKRYFKTNADQK